MVLNRFRSYHFSDLLIISDLVPPGLVGGPAHCAPSQVSILRCRLFVTIIYVVFLYFQAMIVLNLILFFLKVQLLLEVLTRPFGKQVSCRIN